MAEAKQQHVTLVIHHNDMDGWFSAHIVKNFAGTHSKCYFHEANYGWRDIATNALKKVPENVEITVYIVDFSLGKDELISLASDKRIRCMIWIDHHEAVRDGKPERVAWDYLQQAENVVANKPRRMITYFSQPDEKIGACELVWKYFGEGIHGYENIPVPEAIEFVGAYDSWRDDRPDWETLIMPTFFLLNTMDWNPEVWDVTFFTQDKMGSFIGRSNTKADANFEVFSLRDPECLRDGNLIFDELKHRWDERLRAGGYAKVIDGGYRAYILFTADWGSLIFGNKMKEYDLCIGITYLPKTKLWSLRCYSNKPNVNVAEICARIQPATPENGMKGGGGHKGAAGCKVKDITPYLLE